MNDLIAFITARLGEDAAAAEAASGATEAVDWMPSGRTPDAAYSAFREHIARHDPARALREVEADRRLLAEWQKAEADPAIDDQWNAGFAAGLRLAVQIRTARYGGHPDYRQEWKP